MREIKFRALVKSEKRMIEVVDLYFAKPLEVSGYDRSIDGAFESLQPEEYELMQYTGLKDKNGKEIYEGDVVKYIYYPKKDYELGLICYEVGSWWIKGDVLSSFGKLFEGFMPAYPPSLPNENWEVIGNIYQNPELL